MSERFLIRTVGGPFPGTRVASDNEYAWPLPDVLEDPEMRGVYRKGTESKLPPQEPDSHIMRGAEYFWEPADGEAVMCGAIGCTNPATHTWSGHPTCDDCATPMSGRRRAE